MTPNPTESERYRLLSSWCEGTISDAEMGQLDALLREDPDFRRMYLAYLDQHAVLAIGIERMRVPGSPGKAKGTGAWAADPTGRADSDDDRSWSCRSARRSWATPMVVASLLLVCGLAGLFWVGGRSAAPGPIGRTRGEPPETGLAIVVELDAVQWEATMGAVPTRGTVLGPGRIGLRSGRAVLSFYSGVVLTVEGEADVELVSGNRVFCRRGRLRARVPAGAEGFVVASPEAAVVDLGTEFALNIEADGRTRVMVFEGKAEAALLDERGSPRHTRLVSQDEAFDLDPRTGRIVESAASPSSFAHSPDPADQALVLDPSYAGTVLRARPQAYWRFESIVEGAVPNEVEGGPPLRVVGPVRLSGQPWGNSYAVFRAGQPDQCLATDAVWRLGRRPGHAVEFWFAAESYQIASLVGLLPPADPFPHGHPSHLAHAMLLEITAMWGHASLIRPASVRFLHRWPLDARVGSNICSRRIYVPWRWHHVVAQKDGARMDLYFDGVREDSLPLEPDHPDLLCRLVVGRRMPDQGDDHDRRSFVGRLDELAIYDRPLTDEEVRNHYRLGTLRSHPE